MSSDMAGKVGGIIVVALISLLQGCGHKGPLILSAPQGQASSPQIPEAQKPHAQKLDLPPPQQNK